MELPNAMKIPTLEEWLVDDLPNATLSMSGDEAEGRRLSEACYYEHLQGIKDARKQLESLGLSRQQLDQLATLILEEEEV